MNSENKMKEVSEKEFTQDVNNGMSKAELVTKYELSPANIKTIAKSLGLTIKRTVKPKFVLVKDVNKEVALNEQ